MNGGLSKMTLRRSNWQSVSPFPGPTRGYRFLLFVFCLPTLAACDPPCFIHQDLSGNETVVLRDSLFFGCVIFDECALSGGHCGDGAAVLIDNETCDLTVANSAFLR
jgi:hypothetical protein